MITREELIRKYLAFFEKKGHKIIPSASLVPQNDPTVLFTTAGMHPLVPYLTGQKHPLGKRLCNVQKCVRTGDIDSVGDTTHHTFFEMMGNWSLGDYFKKEAITMTFEFQTEVLGIPLEKYAVTCFEGDENAKKDEESAKIWESLGIKKERIAFLPKEDNWWGPAGKTGPCGPDTEQFFWKDKKVNAPKVFDASDKRWVEIGNDVLMQYIKNEDETFVEAKQKNIDFGGGVERVLAVLNGFDDSYKTEIWSGIIQKIETISKKKYGESEEVTRAMRIVADHIRAAIFIISDGVLPSNTAQGYVLRRLIRRAIRYGKMIELKNFTAQLVDPISKVYQKTYPELASQKDHIKKVLEDEEEKFGKSIDEGIREFEKMIKQKKAIAKEKFVKFMNNPNKSIILGRILEQRRNKKKYEIKDPKITEEEIEHALVFGKEAFLLYQSYGFPLELIDEIAISKQLIVDHHEFREELAKHQESSRTNSAGMFKSGLADHSEETTRLHTATHLLNEALRQVVDPSIKQKGSNITAERLRFDFSCSRKVTSEELKKVEDWINDKIKRALPVERTEMKKSEAEKLGAQMEFGAKYPEMVSVYGIVDPKTKEVISREFCTGPHVKNTRELHHFKIIKEEASSAGVRRIKAIVE